MSPSEDLTSWAMFSLGVVMLIVILLRRAARFSKRKSRRKKEAELRPPAVQPSEQLPLVDSPTDLVRWQVEMHTTARDLKAELDSKIRVLMATTKLAHEAADRLEETIARSQSTKG